MSDGRRTRDRLKDILNGDWSNLDANTSRALGVLADVIDEVFDGEHKTKQELADLRKTVMGVGLTTVTILVAAAVGVFFR